MTCSRKGNLWPDLFAADDRADSWKFGSKRIPIEAIRRSAYFDFRCDVLSRVLLVALRAKGTQLSRHVQSRSSTSSGNPKLSGTGKAITTSHVSEKERAVSTLEAVFLPCCRRTCTPRTFRYFSQANMGHETKRQKASLRHRTYPQEVCSVYEGEITAKAAPGGEKCNPAGSHHARS